MVSADCAVPPWTHNSNTENLQHRRSQSWALRVRSRRFGWIETRKTQALPQGPTGLTATQSRPADLFNTVVVLGTTAALDVRVWPPPMQQRLEETRRGRHLIENCQTTGMKSHTCPTYAFTVDPLSARRADMQQTLHPAATANRCRQNRFSTKTRNPHCSFSPESSHDTGSSAEPFSTSRTAPRQYH